MRKHLNEARNSVLDETTKQQIISLWNSLGINKLSLFLKSEPVQRIIMDFYSTTGQNITQSVANFIQNSINHGVISFTQNSTNTPNYKSLEAVTSTNGKSLQDVKLSTSTSTLLKFAAAAEEGKDNVESVEERVMTKYKGITNKLRNLINNKSTKTLYILAGGAGLGKTYTVKDSLKQLGFTEANEGKKEDKVYIYNKGSIGKTLTNLIAFFYTHKDEQLLVLDDCDDFFTNSGDQAVQNFLKAIFTTGVGGGNVTIPATMTRRVNKMLFDESCIKNTSRGTIINVKNIYKTLKENNLKKDARYLREKFIEPIENGGQDENGVISLGYDGNDSYKTKFKDVVDKFVEVVENKILKDYRKLYEIFIGLEEEEFEIVVERYLQSDLDNNIRNFTGKEIDKCAEEYIEGLCDNFKDELPNNYYYYKDFEASSNNKDLTDEDDGRIGNSFLFNSTLVCLTNLELEEIDQAVKDRAITTNFNLNKEEYVCRLGMILEGYGKGQHRDFEASPEEFKFHKKVSYEALTTALELDGVSDNPLGAPFTITKHLSFRTLLDGIDLSYEMIEDNDWEEIRDNENLYLKHLMVVTKALINQLK